MTGSILKHLKQAGGFAAGIAAHHYGSQFLDNIGKEVGKEEETLVRESFEIVDNKLNTLSEQVTGLTELQRKSMDSNIEFINSAEKVIEVAKNVEESAKYITENGATKESVGKLNNDTNILIDAVNNLKDIFSGKSGGNSSSFVLESYKDYINFLDSLTLLQESAFVHMLFFTYIIMTLFSLIAVFFGNELIKYFDLENKKTYLSRFLKLRAKYQRYYLLWNFFMLFLVCIVGIFLNILAFTAK